jgi:hypothetical protein
MSKRSTNTSKATPSEIARLQNNILELDESTVQFRAGIVNSVLNRLNGEEFGDGKDLYKSDARFKTMLWDDVYIHFGINYALERVGGYFTNLAVVSALLGGFSITIMFECYNSIKVGSQYMQDIVALSGTASFLLFFFCVSDCVLLDNYIKQVPSAPAFISFLHEYAHWIRIPDLLFSVGVLTLMVELLSVLNILYSEKAFLFGVMTAIVCLVAIYGRYVLARSHLEKSQWRWSMPLHRLLAEEQKRYRDLESGQGVDSKTWSNTVDTGTEAAKKAKTIL